MTYLDAACALLFAAAGLLAISAIWWSYRETRPEFLRLISQLKADSEEIRWTVRAVEESTDVENL